MVKKMKKYDISDSKKDFFSYHVRLACRKVYGRMHVLHTHSLDNSYKLHIRNLLSITYAKRKTCNNFITHAEQKVLIWKVLVSKPNKIFSSKNRLIKCFEIELIQQSWFFLRIVHRVQSIWSSTIFYSLSRWTRCDWSSQVRSARFGPSLPSVSLSCPRRSFAS